MTKISLTPRLCGEKLATPRDFATESRSRGEEKISETLCLCGEKLAAKSLFTPTLSRLRLPDS